MNKLLRITIVYLTTGLLLLTSCKEEYTDRYPSYEKAKQEGLFDKGWIPVELAFNAVTDTYPHTNLDFNTCIFSCKLPASNGIKRNKTSHIMETVSLKKKHIVNLDGLSLANSVLSNGQQTLPFSKSQKH